MWCWGAIDDGATGTDDDGDDIVPTRVMGMGAVGLIAAGEYETCAASVDGKTIWCWGLFLDVNDGTDTPTLVPTVDASVVELSAGRAVTCGRFDDETVRCWGQNAYGVLGQGTAFDMDASSNAPLAVAGLPNPAQLCMSYQHACVVDTSHVLRCWGENDDGELGPVDAGTFAATPLVVGVGSHVKKIACGVYTECVLDDDAGVQCWGYDYEGELGVTDPAGSILAPLSIPNLGPATDVFAGGFGSCATLVGGGAACWGNDANLQLGAGSQLPPMPLGAFPIVF